MFELPTLVLLITASCLFGSGLITTLGDLYWMAVERFQQFPPPKTSAGNKGMKSLILRLAIAALTFLIGFLAHATWGVTQRPVNMPPVNSSKPPTPIPGNEKMRGISPATPVAAVTQSQDVYTSPDSALRVRIVPAGKFQGYERYESRVEISNRRGSLLYTRSYASADGNHGEGVGHAEWSGDSQFFVFNTSSSGGHQPWHLPTYFYSRRANRVYRLDDFVGPVTTDFVLRAPDVIEAKRLDTEDHTDMDGLPVTARLSKVSRRDRQ